MICAPRAKRRRMTDEGSHFAAAPTKIKSQQDSSHEAYARGRASELAVPSRTHSYRVATIFRHAKVTLRKGKRCPHGHIAD